MNSYSDDINRFNSHAHDWWNPEGGYRLLHDINPLRLNFIQQYTALTKKSILDVGCGGGILSESLAQLGANVSALDLAPDVIAVAKQHAQESGLTIDYQCLSAESLAQQQQTFDVVCCFEMLEHIPHPEQMMKTLSRLCKPGGWVFVSTINRNTKAWLGMILLAEKWLKWLPSGTHNVSRFIQPSEVEQWATQYDLQFKQIQGLSFDPLLWQFKLSRDTSINYLQAYQKLS